MLFSSGHNCFAHGCALVNPLRIKNFQCLDVIQFTIYFHNDTCFCIVSMIRNVVHLLTNEQRPKDQQYFELFTENLSALSGLLFA